MLYDAFSRPLGATPQPPPEAARRLVQFEPNDRVKAEQSTGLDPARLGAIFRSANSGDPTAQAKLSEEILEKDWDIFQAVQTRAGAAASVDFSLLPGADDDAAAERIADEARDMLRAVSPADHHGSDIGFSGLVHSMLGALLPGYDCCEIIWGKGGESIEAFAPVPRDAITFRQSAEPLIATVQNPLGLPLSRDKFVFHRHRSMSGDATRGGLIRPLGWMYLFGNLGIKDLVRFVEKFGMPFVAARIDENAWQTDRSNIASLVRNFGSDGGGVFSKSVELDFLEAASSQAGGEVFFRLLDYIGNAKTRVVIGQTATSSDGGGLSADNAQSAVRQDLLESDCEQLARTIRDAILRPWTAWNYGPDAPVPVLKFACEPPEDRAQLSEVAAKVASQMGYELDPAWIEETFGVRLARDAAGVAQRRQGGGMAGLMMTGESEKKKPLLSKLSRQSSRAIAALDALAANASERARPAAASMLAPVAQILSAVRSGLPAAAADPDAPQPVGSRAAGVLQRRCSALADRLPQLFAAMPWEPLYQAVLEALAAATANGRAQRAAELEDSLSLADPSPARAYLTEPLGLDAAERWLSGNRLLPTIADSARISAILPVPLRSQAFFSAQVAAAGVLEELRATCAEIASGRIGYYEGLRDLSTFVARQGYGIPPPGDTADADLGNLGSMARLNLVMRQNVAMAHAVAQRQVSELPEVASRWPSYRYVANTDRHSRFNGLVLPKSDPFWAVHYPPWEFNCQCMVLDEDEPPNAQTTGFGEQDPQSGRVAMPNGLVEQLSPAASGFAFDSRPAVAFAEPDLGAISDAQMRLEAAQRAPRPDPAPGIAGGSARAQAAPQAAATASRAEYQARIDSLVREIEAMEAETLRIDRRLRREDRERDRI